MRRFLPLMVLLAGSASAQETDDWTARLASRKYEVRELAKQELVAMDLECLPIAAALLGSGNDDACRSTRDVLGRLGPRVIPFLMENAGGANVDVRYYAVSVLGDLAPDSAVAVPLLADALGADDIDLAYEAAWALAALREHAAPAAPALAVALEHREPLVRKTAAGALAAIGASARASLPALLARLDDADASTRRAAAEALAAIGLEDPATVPRLVESLTDENVYVRMSAARALGTLGPAAGRAVEPLRSSLEDPALVPDVAWALERITGEAPTGAESAADHGSTASGDLPESPGTGWRMLGGAPDRNAVSTEVGIPDDWDVDSGKHVAWSVPLGSTVYAGPVVSGGRVYIGAGNERPYRAEVREPCGTLLAFDAKGGAFLWQDHAPDLARQADFLLPSTTSTPLVEGDRVYYVTAQCQLRCLDARGFHDEQNDGAYVDEDDTAETAADVLWQLDMAATLGVFPHEACNCSVLSAGNVLLVCTSNGVDEAHTRVPSPRAPSFIGVNKTDGSLLWRCVGPGAAVLHGQWSSPALGRVGERELAFFGGGDGWLYAVEPASGRVIWRFDGNAEDAQWRTGSDFAGVHRRNSIIACPLFDGGRVILGLGQDPEHGRGAGSLHAIDPRGEGDVSATRAIWTYRDIGRTITAPVAHEGLLFAADLNGRVHCIDAKSGRRVWMHDTLAPIWGCVILLDGNLLVGNEDGILTVFRAGREKQVLREIELPAALRSGPAVHDGTLYISTDERLYAIRDSS